MSEDAIVIEDVETEITEVDSEVIEVEASTDEEAVIKEEAAPESSPEDKAKEKAEKAQEKIDKRIGEYTKQAKDAERDRDYWKNLAQQQRVAPEPVVAGKTLADFEYDEGKYKGYLVAEAKQEANADVETRVEGERVARMDADFGSREADFAKDHPDYHVVARKEMPITKYMAEVIKSSEKGPDLAYYLGQNDGEAYRLSLLPPLQMVRELTLIEATKLVKPPEGKKITDAPRPTPKIEAVDSKVKLKISDPKISDAQFRKMREQQIANR